ncbi:hypothetical protein BU24DRAFT_891 [Aaosphaeria arxii CBS 175.79]|uniref:Uncharacterized protein n=1 Tax=Aaosphaeria arxii CBS 175.79 TaxID=1450172 RepID=A0A6A5Y554_9PLEO|nr:uncharacterized protein BU24DRAFT_891 [Aaosphaeria arxii CBS 175.79]KAF2020406.1 hypothetical protein BU24DRAFT_891 [Aaosphaeria arxii CBS 175.79]
MSFWAGVNLGFIFCCWIFLACVCALSRSFYAVFALRIFSLFPITYAPCGFVHGNPRFRLGFPDLLRPIPHLLSEPFTFHYIYSPFCNSISIFSACSDVPGLLAV